MGLDVFKRELTTN